MAFFRYKEGKLFPRKEEMDEYECKMERRKLMRQICRELKKW